MARLCGGRGDGNRGRERRWRAREIRNDLSHRKNANSRENRRPLFFPLVWRAPLEESSGEGGESPLPFPSLGGRERENRENTQRERCACKGARKRRSVKKRIDFREKRQKSPPSPLLLLAQPPFFFQFDPPPMISGRKEWLFLFFRLILHAAVLL